MRSLKYIFDKRHRNFVSWRVAVLGIVLPNLLYIISSLFYAPFRSANIIILGLVVFAGLIINRFVYLGLLFLVMFLDFSTFIAKYFQIPLAMVYDSVIYLPNLSIYSSLSYLAVGLLLLLCFAGTYAATQQAKHQQSKLSPVPLVLVWFCYFGADWWLNAPPYNLLSVQRQLEGTFSPLDDSASLRAHLEKRIVASEKPNVLLVIVEGLGELKNQQTQRLIWGPLLANELKEHYSIQSGSTAYYGSTTAAEARELCSLKADYRDFRDKAALDCLPQLARDAGYHTSAFHAFTGTFFERFDWYPKIGFQDYNFLENRAGLQDAKNLPHCGLVFEGLCDTDVARSVGNFLRAETSTPKFAYWLTLNSHKPVAPGEVPERLNCGDGGVFGDVELCRMAEQWLHISYLVKDIALDPKLESTEIVLVGDHHPPLFTRKGRNQFEPGKVAWLHLKPRSKEPESVAAHPVSDDQRVASARSGTSTEVR